MSSARCGAHIEITGILWQNQRGQRGRRHLTILSGRALPVPVLGMGPPWDQNERGSRKPGFFENERFINFLS